jgi:hypothetical protein
MIQTRFEGEIRKEVLDLLLPEAFQNRVKKEELKVVGQPDVSELKSRQKWRNKWREGWRGAYSCCSIWHPNRAFHATDYGSITTLFHMKPKKEHINTLKI